MTLFIALVRRDLTLGFARLGGILLPLVFFMLVVSLFPFAIGPDPKLLARVAGGVLWVAALLAALLPIDTLIEPDRADGTLDQYLARGLAPETVAAARIVAHWLTFAPPLLITVVVAAALLNLAPEQFPILLAGLALGTPALASLAVVAACLTAGLRSGGALAGLLVLPLALPVLIFGSGLLLPGPGGEGALRLLAASSLVLSALGPFAAGAGLRTAQD